MIFSTISASVSSIWPKTPAYGLPTKQSNTEGTTTTDLSLSRPGQTIYPSHFAAPPYWKDNTDNSKVNDVPTYPARKFGKGVMIDETLWDTHFSRERFEDIEMTIGGRRQVISPMEQSYYGDDYEDKFGRNYERQK